MIHPYKSYDNETPIALMQKIKVKLELCTLYKGVPCGFAIISYDKSDEKELRFRGFG
jgi:hypothetical protein